MKRPQPDGEELATIDGELLPTGRLSGRYAGSRRRSERP